MNHTDTAVIIINPTSGRERAPRYLPLLEEVLAKRYASVIVKTTEKAGDATDFAREAARAHYDIFCMGGDGTINEVINGRMQVESPSVFGFIPFGTVNDLARALHIPRSPRGAIRMLETAEETKIDVGRVNGRYFINIVAAGLIPEAVSQVTIKEKTLFGSLAYFMKGFQVLPRQKSYHSSSRRKAAQSSACPLPSSRRCSPTPRAASAISSRRKTGIKASSSSPSSAISTGSTSSGRARCSSPDSRWAKSSSPSLT